MPDEAEVREVFLRTGSVGKVARHYDVPRYTAQAWVDRLRRMGQLEDRKPLSS
jgi:transposase-like protein